MLDQNDLQAIAALIKNEVEPINKRLDSMEKDMSDLKSDLSTMKHDISTLQSDVAEMKEDIEVIKEDCEITRAVTNDIGEWVDFYFHEDRPYPIDKEEIKKQRDTMRFAK